jgi:hypothetical protein
VCKCRLCGYVGRSERKSSSGSKTVRLNVGRLQAYTTTLYCMGRASRWSLYVLFSLHQVQKHRGFTHFLNTYATCLCIPEKPYRGDIHIYRTKNHCHPIKCVKTKKRDHINTGSRLLRAQRGFCAMGTPLPFVQYLVVPLPARLQWQLTSRSQCWRPLGTQESLQVQELRLRSVVHCSGIVSTAM